MRKLLLVWLVSGIALGLAPLSAEGDAFPSSAGSRERVVERGTTAEDCRRHRVVWSAGAARRGPDRIHPRPVRSRWQTQEPRFIRCDERVGAFRGLRVSDTPDVR